MRPARFVVPFCFSAALFAAVFTMLIRHGLHQDHNVFVYPLDDAYIHLAVARNLALHGVWGVTPAGFSGASSSPCWTLLLALIARILGVHLLTPLVVNGLAALCLLLLASTIVARTYPQASPFATAAGLCVLVLVVPLPGLAMIGMEHVVHSLFVLLFVAQAAAIAARSLNATKPSSTAVLLFSAAAIGALRYESCFVVLAAVAVLLLRRRIALALAVCVSAAVGPIAYAAYSREHSGLLLPFSVVMKSLAAHGSAQTTSFLSSEVTPILILLVVLLLVRQALRPRDRSAPPFWTFAQAFLLITLGTVALHAVAGPVGWLMRYEAYLFVLAAMSCLLFAVEEVAVQRQAGRFPLTPATRWLAVAFAVALIPCAQALLHRIHHGYSDIAVSTHDRFVEHLPQALFIAQNMPHAAVVANDIGFLAFYAGQIRILDPLGLGSIEPVHLALAHQAVDPAFMAQWAAREDSQVAILHTDFPGMDSAIPAGWTLVESWCFPSNLVFENHVETFYAPDQASAETLRQHLAAFQQLSPEIVRYRFPADGDRPPAPPRGEIAACPAAVRP